MAQPQPQATASEGPCRTAFKRGVRMVWRLIFQMITKELTSRKTSVAISVCGGLLKNWNT